MSITKHTGDLLNIRCLSLKSVGTLVRFNRPRGEMVITWLAGIIPFRRTILPLTEIAGAQVRKVERNSGRITYGVVLRRRRSSADLSFDCTSREDAMTVMREIASFLEIKTEAADPQEILAAPQTPDPTRV